ncbi:MAG: hypothetical protein WEB58_05100 [Planctomycetaceae bacterium]
MRSKSIVETLFLVGLCLAAWNASYSKWLPFPYEDEPELKGHDFVPPRQINMSEEERINHSGLAEWSIGETNLKKARIVGFEVCNDYERFDWTTTDPVILDTIIEALQTARRYALSDFSEDRGGRSFCGHTGVVVLEFEDRKLIIGLDCVFYFGVWRGSPHQCFTSWLLAKQLGDILKKHAKSGLPEHLFADLSGERDIERQKIRYEELRAKDDGNE